MQREGKATGGGRVMGVRCRAGARLTVSRRFARREGAGHHVASVPLVPTPRSLFSTIDGWAAVCSVAAFARWCRCRVGCCMIDARVVLHRALIRRCLQHARGHKYMTLGVSMASRSRCRGRISSMGG